MNAPNAFDPFSVLATADVPVSPDADFARRLRTRLERGLELPEGVTMSTDIGSAPSAQTLTSEIQTLAERPGALPYLTVSDPAAAIEWYVAHLGARLRGEPIVMDDGTIGHAELLVGGGVIYLAGEFPDLGLRAPLPQSVSVSLMLAVTDTDATFAQARDGGAAVQREPYEDHGARTGVIVDPFGHRWMITGPMTGARVEQIHRGDIGYCSLWTTDVDRAAAFYGSVLGWEFNAATHQVTNLSHRLGIYSVPGDPTMLCVYAVDDIDIARADIIAAGGTPNQLQEFGFGELLDAVDNQGVAFSVYRPTALDPRPSLNATGHGELTYMTFYTPDSSRLRDFYGRVLGWTFNEGRVDDGWEVEGMHPMTGFVGGQDRSVAVPMWVVDDIEVAVQRVREGGGTVIAEPSQQPYAITAECLDDQGARFYLGQY
ncbi:VOC family protein [Nocardia sp. 348MFTsu5.1]|uniref:VOC family protein n=1 Tax=Nocardia sp. 348MFTsu5.1 TaxID=1172185 RepID=UPI00036F3AAC|nr:VOC family protein [Nocardia sp. 348MFTsu5.1]